MTRVASKVAQRYAEAQLEERDLAKEQVSAQKERFSVAPPGWENIVKKNKGDKPSHPSKKTALRVAARYQRAFEFPSPEALKHYLHDHPDADKSKHTVKKPGEDKPKAEETPDEKKKDEKKDHGGHGEEKKPKKSWRDVVKGLSQAAKTFVTKAPESIQKFVNDDTFRRDALMKAHKAVTEAPEKFIQQAIHHAKHEAAEIKEAGHGILAVARGDKMSPSQKKAVKTIVTHVAIAAVATALGGGLGIGAAALAKGTAAAFVSSLAKKIVLKSVISQLGHLPMIEEMLHAGHGAVHMLEHVMEHFASEKPDMTPDQAFDAYLSVSIAKGIKDLDPETMAEALEELGKGGRQNLTVKLGASV